MRIKTRQLGVYRKDQGFALIISLIFIVIFSAIAVSMATLSGANVQIADTQRQSNRARACAESGLDIVRLWSKDVLISGTITPSQRFNLLATSFQSHVSDISSITPSFDGITLAIPSVTLDSSNDESFYASMIQFDSETLQVDVTGVCGSITRTIRVNYKFGTNINRLFDFGVASKGPVALSGNIELTGINVSVEASVYIESENSNLALSIIGNSQIAGNVDIVNPLANVFLQGGQAGIGGETGQDAIDNHVTFGSPPTDFPTPDPGHFQQFIINTIDDSTDTSADATFENVRIAAGTNPNFTGQVTLKGIVFIEVPNVVTFTGNTTITGVIVGNGSIDDNSGTNQINFNGSVISNPISDLPDESQFIGIKEEYGTFVMAPGFDLTFAGNFNTLHGGIAGNGITFWGDAGGTINGSVLNFSDDAMILHGNSDLFFNRSGVTETPAGFMPEIILEYDSSSYVEVVL